MVGEVKKFLMCFQMLCPRENWEIFDDAWKLSGVHWKIREVHEIDEHVMECFLV